MKKIKRNIGFSKFISFGKVIILVALISSFPTCENESKYCEKICLDGYKALTSMDCKCPEDNLSEMDIFRFYTSQLYDIDVITDLDYLGYEKLDFRNGTTSVFESHQRLIIALAKILRSWENDSLYADEIKRLVEIQRYCGKKLISTTDTIEWSAGLISYIYYTAGIPLETGINEFWCLPSPGELTSYFIQNNEFVDFFSGADRQNYTPDIGDILVQDTNLSITDDDHYMMIIGPLIPKGIWEGKVVVMEGDIGGTNHVDGKVAITIRDVINDHSIRGIGKRQINEPYVILFDEIDFNVKDHFSSYPAWKLSGSVSKLADLVPSADNLPSSIYCANRVKMRLFYEADYTGKSITISHSDVDLRLSDFHNCISSVKFE